MALNFLRDFSLKLFKNKNYSECYEVINKANNLTEYLNSSDKVEYQKLLKQDEKYLSIYSEYENNLKNYKAEQGINCLDKLLNEYKESIYYDELVINVNILKCLINLNDENAVIELGNKIESISLDKLLKNINQVEIKEYLRLNKSSKINEVQLINNNNEIGEEII